MEKSYSSSCFLRKLWMLGCLLPTQSFTVFFLCAGFVFLPCWFCVDLCYSVNNLAGGILKSQCLEAVSVLKGLSFLRVFGQNWGYNSFGVIGFGFDLNGARTGFGMKTLCRVEVLRSAIFLFSSIYQRFVAVAGLRFLKRVLRLSSSRQDWGSCTNSNLRAGWATAFDLLSCFSGWSCVVADAHTCWRRR